MLSRLLQSSLLRFLLVGGLGELLYLGLYFLIWQLSAGQAPLAIGLAGGICIVVNALLHARVSFRVSFSRRLLLIYAAIQLLCLGISALVGWLLQRLGLSGPLIGVASTLLWSSTSFLLTRSLFRSGKASAGRPPQGSG